MSNLMQLEKMILGAVCVSGEGRIVDLLFQNIQPASFSAEGAKLLAECLERWRNKDFKRIELSVCARGLAEPLLRDFINNPDDYSLPEERLVEYLDDWHERKSLSTIKSIVGDVDSITKVIQAVDMIKAGMKSRDSGDIARVFSSMIDGIKKGNSFHKSGFAELDEFVGVLGKGLMTVIGARTSHGKTAFALNLAVQMIMQKKKVMLCTLEMSPIQVMKRMIAIIGGIRLDKLNLGLLTDKDWETINRLKEWLEDNKDYFQIINSFDVAQIRNKAIKFKPDVLIIDYIQLMNPESTNTAASLEQISAQLQSMCISDDISVVALSQLNRQVDNRENNRVQLNDLRSSGGIEQSADIVMIMNWMYKWDNEKYDINIMDFHILKNRNGATGRVQLRFDPEYTKFDSFKRPNKNPIGAVTQLPILDLNELEELDY